MTLLRLIPRYLGGLLCFFGWHAYVVKTSYRRESATLLRLPDDSVLVTHSTQDFPSRGKIIITSRACRRCGHEAKGN